MEAPAGRDPDTIKNAQVAALAGDRRRPTRRSTCAASTTGTSTIAGVAAGSTTETYAALRLEIDNWRWSGVPFYIRTGKLLPATQTEFRLVFKRPPRLGLRLPGGRAARAGRTGRQARPVDRRPAPARRPPVGRARTRSRSTSTWSSPSEGGEGPTPYEVLLQAAMAGNSTRFTRQDGVEETWRIMQTAARLAAAGQPLRAGHLGTGGGGRAGRRVRRLARPVGRVVAAGSQEPRAGRPALSTGRSPPARNGQDHHAAARASGGDDHAAKYLYWRIREPGTAT